MKTITKNPNHIIPDITESEFEHSLFIVRLFDNSRHINYKHSYIGILLDRMQTNCGSLCRDNIIILGTTFEDGLIENNRQIRWSPCGNSLIETLCDIWKWYSPNFDIEVTVLESLLDIDFWIKFSNLPYPYQSLAYLTKIYVNLPNHRRS